MNFLVMLGARGGDAVADELQRILFRDSVASTISDVRVSPSGHHVLVQSAESDDLRVWRWLSDGSLHEAGVFPGTSASESGWLPEIAFHPTKPFAALVGRDRPISVWDLVTRACVAEFGDLKKHEVGPECGYWGAAFSHDGRHLETHSLALKRGERYEWKTGHLVGVRWGPGGNVSRTPETGLLAVSDDGEWGSRFFFGRWQNREFEWFTPEVILDFPVTKMCFAPGLLAFFGGVSRYHVQIHDFPTCKARFFTALDMLTEEMEEEHGVGNAFTVAPDGSYAWWPTIQGEIVAAKSTDGAEVRRFRLDDDLVMALDVHPHLPRLLVGAADGTLSVMEIGDSPWKTTSSKTQSFTSEFAQRGGDPSNPDDTVVWFERS